MAIQQGIWKFGTKPEPVKSVVLESEAILEDQIFAYISILNIGWIIDPVETEERAVNTVKKGKWNGEYYGSFDVSDIGLIGKLP